MQNNKSLVRFLAIALGIYLLWFLFHDLKLLNNGWLDSWLSQHVALTSAALLSFIGYETATQATTLLMNGRQMVYIGDGCNGLVLLVLFTGFVLAFPGPARLKLFYIPIGMAAIYFINVLRVMALALTALYQPQALDFNHKYTFSFVVYACIFGMWMLWVKKFSGITLTHHAHSPAPEKQTA